jgi:hypothetical protein
LVYRYVEQRLPRPPDLGARRGATAVMRVEHKLYLFILLLLLINCHYLGWLCSILFSHFFVGNGHRELMEEV